MGIFTPKKIFFTNGVGRHRQKLESFEAALRDAGIQQCNLVKVSSIFPPGCEIISREKGSQLLKPGNITFVVMSRNATNEPNRLVAASVGFAQPKDPAVYGYLSEHHSFGETDEKAGEKAEDMAASMLASTLGIEFNVDEGWDEKEQVFKLSGKFVKTSNVSQSAVCDKDGNWTTVVAAAVFIMDEDNGSVVGVQQ
ncbi:Pyruvoyl-dependent arginine decarboxylase [Candidatus Burarchaeum australiense]|nr:Pyruvoyl-dependent arginine decarboxylase [Candidatus Burarchaeum australiense]